MNPALESMLSRYELRSSEHYAQALREIVQELALLGLWRSKFFEHAALYGGTALRILHGLNRFSEDLEFSLLRPRSDFPLDRHLDAVRMELASFGFDVEVRQKDKAVDNRIHQGLVQGRIRTLLVAIGAQQQILLGFNPEQKIKVKLELDVDPPPGFTTHARTLLQPIPFSVNAYQPPDLFAGKLHAVLCRRWKTRVNGRDWYDLVWFVGRTIPARLSHLQHRLEHRGNWPGGHELDSPGLQELLHDRIEKLDVASAQAEVEPFVDDPASILLWSRDFFHDLVTQHLRTT